MHPITYDALTELQGHGADCGGRSQACLPKLAFEIMHYASTGSRCDPRVMQAIGQRDLLCSERMMPRASQDDFIIGKNCCFIYLRAHRWMSAPDV